MWQRRHGRRAARAELSSGADDRLVVIVVTAVVTVAVLRQRDGSIAVPTEASISGIRRVLAGESVALDFRAVYENDLVSYIAVTDIPDHGPLLLEIEARPAGSDTRLAARITRQFDEG